MRRGGVVFRRGFELPPSGSLLLFLSKQPLPAGRTPGTLTRLAPAGPPEVRRLEPNVLTLDFVDVTAGGDTQHDVYCYAANQFVWRKNGMERDPWDSAVQYKDELISKKFAPDSGFEATYKFTLESAVPKNLTIVIERPDLYTIRCNGQPIQARAGEWWLDKAFGRIPIAAQARVGENHVTIKATPFTMFHELEPAYLLGDFALKPVARGFVVASDQPIVVSKGRSALTHSFNPDGTMWLSGGIGFGEGEDRAPSVTFDLGRPADLGAIMIWNYNENHVRDLTSRGASRIRLTGAAVGAKKSQPGEFNIPIGTFDLPRANGGDALAQTLTVKAPGVRFVRCDILANHAGVSYPAAGQPEDNGFVGLAEVQFFGGNGEQLTGVKVLRASSELAGHGRQAVHLVDGTGLDSGRPGWNTQGHPFYSAGVAYRERFDMGQLHGRYCVALTDWYGSAARVTVNGKPAGWIVAPPWKCDVTPWLQRGSNEIEITVIGTLKNTLGPHHGNPGLGAAWPSAFHQGPASGPPPGAQYSTVAYGLFEPFALQSVSE